MMNMSPRACLVRVIVSPDDCLSSDSSVFGALVEWLSAHAASPQSTAQMHQQ